MNNIENKENTIVSVEGRQTSNLIATATTMEAKQRYAEEMIRGGLLPATLAVTEDLEDPELRVRAIGAVISVVEFGREMGLNPWIAVQNIHNIQGKPTAGIHIYTAIAQANGIIVDVIDDYKLVKNAAGKTIDAITTVEITRKYDKLNIVKTHRYTKSWLEIIDAGLDQRDNYKKRKKTMLRTRAIVDALRLYASSFFFGLMETSEMADVSDLTYTVDADGNAILDNNK
ncbi:MAG: hypothetical protein KAH32_01765 [Chlamydiia bacterium]|nr:hypothetical protein [Chlamydiia bacterium]